MEDQMHHHTWKLSRNLLREDPLVNPSLTIPGDTNRVILHGPQRQLRFAAWPSLYIFTAFLWLAMTAGSVLASDAPTVMLDNSTVTGLVTGLGFTHSYLGIPFAQPPTGNLRFRLPQPLPPYNTSFSATAHGPACPQQEFKLPLPSGLLALIGNYLTNFVYKIVTPFAEDCLTLNVVTPADATPDSKLPVVVWIFGGGFEFGGTSIYDGSVIVGKAISLGVPAVYVSMNYRVSGFGFLSSQEVKDAGVGNLGLQDQRLALKWVQKYITAFGGDPTKVTLWGESAGAMSIGLHMVTNGGNPDGLFRAAFMQSGSPVPVADITRGQKYYDAIVSETGCSGSNDTLQCLREVPYETLLDAVNKSPGVFSYQSIALTWLPRVDGVFLTDNPQRLVQQGSVANVPFVTGDCDDEGTMFAFANSNITTDDEFEEYVRAYWSPEASDDSFRQMKEHYPSDPYQGSPFGTGFLYALTPQFKRLAAIQGDLVFQAPRRFLTQHRSGKQRIWAYLNKRLKATPFLGTFHASDLLNFYFAGDMTSYLVRFVTHLDPNVGDGTDIYWPEYDAATNRTMLEFSDGIFTTQALTTDTYREKAIAYVMNLTWVYPL